MSVTFFSASDADPSVLDGQTVTVVGYGNLGRAMALNLRDSGLPVLIGNIDDEYRALPPEDGFEVMDIGPAVAMADVVYVLIPDEEIGTCWEREIRPNLKPGAAVLYASGYCLAFGQVDLPDGADVYLLAPRMLGEEVRNSYVDGAGFFAYLDVEQDASGQGWPRLLALALAVGCLQKGALQLSAEQEARLDLFIEQSFGPYVGTAIQLAFGVGVQKGIPAEALVLEMYMSGEMSRTFGTFSDVGFYRSTTWHGIVAQYGGFLRTLDLDKAAMLARFEQVWEDIANGGFAAKLQAERDAGYPTLKAIEAITQQPNDPITVAEDRVRAALSDD